MRRLVLALCGLACTQFLPGQSRTDRSFHPQIPKAWTDAAKTYELPLSYGKRAEHISSVEYYAIPARTIFRSYPIYRPDREPRGYLPSLKSREPQIAFDPAKLKTRQDWILAGAVVFESPNVILPLEETPYRDPEWYRQAVSPRTLPIRQNRCCFAGDMADSRKSTTSSGESLDDPDHMDRSWAVIRLPSIMRLGVDLGTTRTIVAVADRGNYPIVIFENAEGDFQEWYPSLVAICGGERRYGFDAVALTEDPDWTIHRSFKRLLASASPNGSIFGVPIFTLVGEFLTSLRNALETRSNVRMEAPLEVAIGVPANSTVTNGL